MHAPSWPNPISLIPFVDHDRDEWYTLFLFIIDTTITNSLSNSNYHMYTIFSIDTTFSIALSHHVTKGESLGPGNKLNLSSFYWSFCTKPRKWTPMYLCGRVSILLLSHGFSIVFWNCSDSGVFYYFILLQSNNPNQLYYNRNELSNLVLLLFSGLFLFANIIRIIWQLFFI